MFLKLARHFVLCECHSLALSFNRVNGIVNHSNARLGMSVVLADSPCVYTPFTRLTFAIFLRKPVSVERNSARPSVKSERRVSVQ